MTTQMLLTTVSAFIDPDAPETLVHVGAFGVEATTLDPIGFTYDYNIATEDVPSLCEAAVAAEIGFPDDCGV